MPANPLDKLLTPRFPSCAGGIDSGSAAVVQLDRARGGFTVKRAASINLPADLVRASFDESNIDDPAEFTRALSDLLAGAGLLRQRKWSVTLPETSTRAAVLALDGAPSSRRELEEVLEWKIERSFGAPLPELRVSREQLAPNSQRQSRYLVTAVRLSVLAEYEAAFAALGWQAGLILPRHAGEEQWLRNGQQGDGLLAITQPLLFTRMTRKDQTRLPSQGGESCFIFGQHRESNGRDQVTGLPLRVGRQLLTGHAQFRQGRTKAALYFPLEHFFQLAA